MSKCSSHEVLEKGDDVQTLVTVASTSKISWPTWQEFLTWLRGANDWYAFTGGVDGIFLYEDSD